VYVYVGKDALNMLVHVGLVEENGLLNDNLERFDVFFDRNLEAVFEFVHFAQHLIFKARYTRISDS